MTKATILKEVPLQMNILATSIPFFVVKYYIIVSFLDFIKLFEKFKITHLAFSLNTIICDTWTNYKINSKGVR